MTRMPPDATTPTTLSQSQKAALDAVVERANALNSAIAEAVEAGLIVEMNRTMRYHNRRSAWGDQVAPLAIPQA